MNTLKKAYCRVFQQAFHIAIPFLPYRKPKRLFHMEELAALLEKKKISSVPAMPTSAPEIMRCRIWRGGRGRVWQGQPKGR